MLTYSPYRYFLHKKSNALFMQNKKQFKINIWLISRSLLLTSKKRVLLLHLLQTLAGGPVFCILTLLFCGPVLHPGTLTKYILKPENTKYCSVGSPLLYLSHSGSFHLIQLHPSWKQDCKGARTTHIHIDSKAKLTSFQACGCLGTTP